MRLEPGGPLYELSQLLDCMFSTDHDDYETEAVAISQWLAELPTPLLQPLREDVARLRTLAESGHRLAVFPFPLPWDEPGFEDVLDLVVELTDQEERRRTLVSSTG